MYIKSVYTGQVYEVDEMPKFGGYELSTKEEFDAYTVGALKKMPKGDGWGEMPTIGDIKGMNDFF
jgi:hypothetical protein